MVRAGGRLVVSGGTLVTPDHVLPDHGLVVEGGRIAGVEPAPVSIRTGDAVLDAGEMSVIPGMIDLHVHGGSGHHTMDATPEALRGLARFLARCGVTAYLPTTMSAPLEAIRRAIRNAAQLSSPDDGASHLGVHLEGPYLNRDFRGAQPVEYLRSPRVDEFVSLASSGPIAMLTLAPELDGADDLIESAVASGIRVAVGHTGATFEQILKAADLGVRHATHTFNGMAGIKHRQPGAVGGVLADDRIVAHFVADRIHVHPAVLKFAIRSKDVSRSLLISDAIAAGLPDGEHTLGAQRVWVEGPVVRGPAGELAGSTATLDGGLRTLVQSCGLPLQDAVRMTTSVPAKLLGLEGRKGILAPGADADVVLLDRDLTVRATIIGGRLVHRAGDPG